MNKIYCNTRKNIPSEIANHLKTYSSDLNSTSDYVFIPSRTDLEPRLTVRKSITSPVLSPTLLQIYCIGLIGPISNSFLVWVTICGPTILILRHWRSCPNWYTLLRDWHKVCEMRNFWHLAHQTSKSLLHKVFQVVNFFQHAKASFY